MVLHGALVREKIKEDLIKKVKKLGREPVLVIVQVGNREDSNVYIRQKQKFGEEIGVKVLINKFEEDISQKDLEEKVKKISANKNIDGVIIQLPLPKHIDSEKIINLVPVEKDADGLNENFSKKIIPATARGVIALLDHYRIEIKGKKVVVIGQSILAGKPIGAELEKRGAEVFRCDINTKNIPEIARGCDILISAVGRVGLITKEFVNDKQVVIDVGINRTEEGKLVGDVFFDEVKPLVFSITPVPGGVGPLTVACLFQNLVDLCE